MSEKFIKRSDYSNMEFEYVLNQLQNDVTSLEKQLNIDVLMVERTMSGIKWKRKRRKKIKKAMKILRANQNE